MSSILKALKKLEQAPPGAAAGPMSTGAATVIFAREAPPGWLQRWGWPVGLGLAVGLAVLGTGLLRWRPPQPADPPVPLVQSIAAPPPNPAVPFPADRQPASPPPVNPDVAAADAGPPAVAATPDPSSAVGATQDNAMASDPFPAADASGDAATAASLPAARTVAAVDPDGDRFPRLTDDRLALQAIAWSDTVDRRMAVINGDILREGGAIAGYTIRRIRRDDVLVAAQGRTWRLMFRNRE